MLVIQRVCVLMLGDDLLCCPSLLCVPEVMQQQMHRLERVVCVEQVVVVCERSVLQDVLLCIDGGVSAATGSGAGSVDMVGERGS